MCRFLRTGVEHSVYNADEMGLGKTIQTLACCDEMGFKKILIICPAVMRLTWLRQCYKWLKPSTLTNVRCIEDGPNIKRIQNGNIVIISYDLAARNTATQLLIKQGFDCIVLDEAHKLKSTKSIRTLSILKSIWSTTPYRIALSGTPLLTCVTDAWTLFSRMEPGFKDYDQFCNRFSNFVDTGYGRKFVGVKDARLLSRLIRERFFIRRTKAEVLPDLPGKIFSKIILNKKYSVQAYEDELKRLFGPTTTPESDVYKKLLALQQAGNSMPGLKRLQGIQKVEPIEEFTRNLLEQGIPTVLFTYHKEVISKYAALLKDFSPYVLDGSTSNKKKDEMQQAFQAGKGLLFIAQLTAGGVGIDLTRSSNVVLAELDWSPAVIQQAVDRCNRIGTKETTNIFYFVCDNSIDEHISSVVISKARDFKKVLG